MSKKWISLLAICAVILGIAGAAYRVMKHAEIYPATEDAYVAGDMYSVASRIPGTLLTLEMNENEPVKRGAVLATLDPRDADAQVEHAQTSLDEARAAVSTIRAQIAQARAKTEADAARLSLARTNLERFAGLTQRNSIPKARYDEAVSAEAVASADLAASQKAVSAMEANLIVAEQRIRVQETRLANARLGRSYCTITAPEDGIVSKKTASAGQVVAAGQPLCTLVPLTSPHLWIGANFKETQLANIRVGQAVTFRTDVWPKRVYRGWVESLSAGTGAAFSLLPPENATGNWVKIVQRLPVRIAIDPETNRDGSLRVGLSVIVEVDTLAPLRPAAATQTAPST